MKSFLFLRLLSVAAPIFLLGAAIPPASAAPGGPGAGLIFSANSKTASYSIGLRGEPAPVLQAGVAVEADGHWLHSADYPNRAVSTSHIAGVLGSADQWTLTYSGLKDAPDLLCTVSLERGAPYGVIQLTARNATRKEIHIEAFRMIDAEANRAPSSPSHPVLDLGGPASEDRVLSYGFSEDQPAIAVRDLEKAESGLHQGIGSQLVYNRQSHLSWLAAALTTDRFLSVIRLRVNGLGAGPTISSYEVDSEGTTNVMSGLNLRDAPPANRITLSLPVAPGSTLSSERMLFSLSHDYHQQLETYGRIIRELHHARVDAAPVFGWWSWTAYYSGISAGTSLTNAHFLAQNLKQYGYNFFLIDEGYEYARGEYATADATLFPHGVIPVEAKALSLGLVPGLWTGPFEASSRSSIYEHHKDWLVRNAAGAPISVGHGANGADTIYVLDTTNPQAQKYLADEYRTLVRQWHIRYFKLDFMDAASIEGVRYRPDTTALEAQRIGLKVIRDAVGPNVLLDKDGSPMLNPVGYVDMGRISEDTGHTFAATKEVAPGIAARYFMNHNFFLNDPDAFTVSKQTIPDGEWHESTIPLTLDEAKTSIALAAVSGSMFEIGDDLPTLGQSPERMALVTNRDLLDMVRLGQASIPVDLMTYDPRDEQPSIFYLKEDPRQSIVTIFNWTDGPREHTISLSSFGLNPGGRYTVIDVLDGAKAVPVTAGKITLHQPRHSVRVLKMINDDISARAPEPKADLPTDGAVGTTIAFHAEPAPGAVRYEWNMGDGVTLEGPSVTHTYTHDGRFTVKLLTTGLEGKVSTQSFPLTITGSISHRFVSTKKRRYHAR